MARLYYLKGRFTSRVVRATTRLFREGPCLGLGGGSPARFCPTGARRRGESEGDGGDHGPDGDCRRVGEGIGASFDHKLDDSDNRTQANTEGDGGGDLYP